MATRIPEKYEADALSKAGDMLQFAVQNSKDLPKEIIAAITAAIGANQTNSWDDTVAANFWSAFNHLCALIKPVTWETISTSVTSVQRSVLFRSLKPISIAQQTANLYLILLSILLIAAVIFAFALSTANNLKVEITSLVTSLDQLTKNVTDKADALNASKQSDFAQQTTDRKALQDALTQHSTLVDQLIQKTDNMMRIISFGTRKVKSQLGTYAPVKDLDEARTQISDYFVTRRFVSSYIDSEAVYAGVISSSLLPIILGLMGACSYIVRLISDQIKDTSFSKTSPIRHRVRLILGGLAGVV